MNCPYDESSCVSPKHINKPAIANNSIDSLSNLYEYDFNLWVKVIAQLLYDGKLTELDVVNLLEEVESIGNAGKHTLTQILHHS